MYPSPNQHLPSARPALLIRSADTWPTRRQAEARGCFNSLAPALLCPAASLLFLATGVFPPVLWDTNAITPATTGPRPPPPPPPPPTPPTPTPKHKLTVYGTHLPKQVLIRGPGLGDTLT